MTIVEEAQEVISKLPKESSWEDVFYSLYVRQKVDKAMASDDRGEYVSADEARKRLLKK